MFDMVLRNLHVICCLLAPDVGVLCVANKLITTAYAEFLIGSFSLTTEVSRKTRNCVHC